MTEMQKDAAAWLASAGVYTERDRLVAALSKVFPAHLCRHEGADWEDDWRNIVCVHLPTGQATWHIHDSELPWFAHLEMAGAHWDGHTTEEKYERLAKLASRVPDGFGGTRMVDYRDIRPDGTVISEWACPEGQEFGNDYTQFGTGS